MEIGKGTWEGRAELGFEQAIPSVEDSGGNSLNTLALSHPPPHLEFPGSLEQAPSPHPAPKAQTMSHETGTGLGPRGAGEGLRESSPFFEEASTASSHCCRVLSL